MKMNWCSGQVLRMQRLREQLPNQIDFYGNARANAQIILKAEKGGLREISPA